MSKLALGIDVGGSKIAAALVDKSLKLKWLTTIPTSQKNLLKQLIALIDSYKGFGAIGLGMPGQVLESGVVRKLGNIATWQSVNLKKLIENKFKVPVSVINDAKAFALAEAVVGQGKNFQTVVGLILGTGIGAGFILNKKIYFGRNRMAGEIGHFEMLNGKFFEQEVKEAGPFKNAAVANKFLRSLMSFIVRSIDPEIVIVGGGWSNLPGMQKELETVIRTLRKFPLQTKVKVSRLKHAGILGAVLALKQ